MKYLLGLGLLLMALAIPGINLYHHLELPKELTSRNEIRTSYTVNINPYFVHKVVDIYVVDTIKDHKQVQDIVETLNEASSNTIVNLHLSGYGGQAEPTMRIINAMLTSQASVTTIVEAPVYSAHAFIAMYGKTLILKPYVSLMLHTTSAMDLDCSRQTGTNRHMTNEQSCENLKTNHLYLTNTILWNMPRLTVEQKLILISGGEVYLVNTSFDEVIVE